MKLEPALGPRVTVERIRTLFGNAGPVRGEIWESQFDGADDELHRLARTPWEELFDQSFWVYFHDLTHAELQPAVFDYLFPACLVIAQQRLMAGLSGLASGDADFMRSLSARNWTTVCTSDQIQETDTILIEGFLDRLDRQTDFDGQVYDSNGGDWISRYNWFGRLNSLGYILPSIEPLWQRWWSIDSPGQAIAALEYAWDLAVLDDEEDDLDRTLELGSGPSLDADGDIYFRGWEERSLEFLASTLNYDYLHRKSGEAVEALVRTREETTAHKVLLQVERRRTLVETRIAELIAGLRLPADER